MQSILNYLCVCVCVYVQSCWALRHPVDSSPPGSTVHGIFPGKNTGLGCHFLLQEIFLTRGLNPCLLRLLYWQAYSLLLCVNYGVNYLLLCVNYGDIIHIL